MYAQDLQGVGRTGQHTGEELSKEDQKLRLLITLTRPRYIQQSQRLESMDRLGREYHNRLFGTRILPGYNSWYKLIVVSVAKCPMKAKLSWWESWMLLSRLRELRLNMLMRSSTARRECCR